MSQRVTRASAVEDVGVVCLSAVALRVSRVLAPAELLEWLDGGDHVSEGQPAFWLQGLRPSRRGRG
jgi:hypothetical protein